MPDISYRIRQTQFRAVDPADGEPMLIEGYFVVFDQPYAKTASGIKPCG